MGRRTLSENHETSLWRMPHPAATPVGYSSLVAALSASDLSSFRSSDTTTPCRSQRKGQQALHFVAQSLGNAIATRLASVGIPAVDISDGDADNPSGLTVVIQMIISLRPSIILPTGSSFQYRSTRSCSAHVLGRSSGLCRRREDTATRLLHYRQILQGRHRRCERRALLHGRASSDKPLVVFHSHHSGA